jgi:hypothetical protein
MISEVETRYKDCNLKNILKTFYVHYFRGGGGGPYCKRDYSVLNKAFPLNAPLP